MYSENGAEGGGEGADAGGVGADEGGLGLRGIDLSLLSNIFTRGDGSDMLPPLFDLVFMRPAGRAGDSSTETDTTDFR